MEYPISVINGLIRKDFSGGVGCIMRDVAHALKEKGHMLFIVARSLDINQDYSFYDDGIEVFKFASSNHIILTDKITTFLLEFTCKNQIDIIETCDYAPLINQYIGDVPILLRMHISHAFLEYSMGNVSSPYEVKNENYLPYTYSLNLADSICGVSEFILEQQMKFHNFPKWKKYGVIYNGIEYLGNKNEKSPRIYGLFTHGTVSKRKGTDRVCDIFKQIKNVYPEMTLKVIGKGVDFWEQTCWNMIPNEYQNAVTYFDYMPRNELFEHIKNESIYISMSTLEAMSISMLEAMTLGKPMILLRNGSFEEFITDGQEGYLVSNEQEAVDRIRYLLSNPSLYTQLSKAAIKKAKQYTLQKCTDSTENWYKYILKNKQAVLKRRDKLFENLLKEYYKLKKITITSDQYKGFGLQDRK